MWIETPTEAGEKVEGGRDEKETYRMEEVTEKGSRVIFLRCLCGRTCCTLCIVYTRGCSPKKRMIFPSQYVLLRV